MTWLAYNIDIGQGEVNSSVGVVVIDPPPAQIQSFLEHLNRSRDVDAEIFRK